SLLNSLSDLVFRHLGFLAQRESDIVIEGHGVEQGGALKEDAKFLSDFIEFALAQLGDIFSVHQHAAVIRQKKGIQMLQQLGLAGTVATDDRCDLAGFELQIDTFEDRLATEGLVQVNYFNHQPAVGGKFCLAGVSKRSQSRGARKTEERRRT